MEKPDIEGVAKAFLSLIGLISAALRFLLNLLRNMLASAPAVAGEE